MGWERVKRSLYEKNNLYRAETISEKKSVLKDCSKDS